MRLSSNLAPELLLLAATMLIAVALTAQQNPALTPPIAPFDPQAHDVPPDANDLVREVINNQLAHKVQPAYMYRVRKETPSGLQTKEVIETKDGAVSWLLAINDQPLNDEQRRQEDDKLQNLLQNHEEQSKHRKDQKEDDERTRRMLQAMPDAFIYTYDGTEPARNAARDCVRLTFKPNPNFKPPDRETQVFSGMEGHMLVDPAERHMVKIDATLVRNVNFGWGIFGRLDKGGRFMVAQSRIGRDRWDVTDKILDFTGKILLFKRLRIKEHEVVSDFRPVPQDLSLSDGVQMLRQEATHLAQKE